MKKYTVYDKKTGTINKILSCHVSQLLNNLQPEEDYIEGEYIDTEYVIDTKEKKPIKVKSSKTEAVSRNEYEELIMVRMQEIIRRKAIEELKNEGKLPKEYEEN